MEVDIFLYAGLSCVACNFRHVVGNIMYTCKEYVIVDLRLLCHLCISMHIVSVDLSKGKA